MLELTELQCGVKKNAAPTFFPSPFPFSSFTLLVLVSLCSFFQGYRLCRHAEMELLKWAWGRGKGEREKEVRMGRGEKGGLGNYLRMFGAKGSHLSLHDLPYLQTLFAHFFSLSTSLSAFTLSLSPCPAHTIILRCIFHNFSPIHVHILIHLNPLKLDKCSFSWYLIWQLVIGLSNKLAHWKRCINNLHTNNSATDLTGWELTCCKLYRQGKPTVRCMGTYSLLYFNQNFGQFLLV